MDKQTLNTNPSEEELTSEEGMQNASDSSNTGVNADPATQEAALKLIEEQLGRKFSSLEDATKSLKELKSYVGRAGKYEKVVKEFMRQYDLSTEEDAVSFVDELANLERTEKPANSSSSADDIQSLKSKNQELEFMVLHPEEKQFMGLAKKLAKADGIVLEEARNLQEYKDFVSAKIKSQEQEVPNFLTSNKRLGSTEDKELAGIIEEVKKPKATDAIKDELVKRTLLRK